jgi:F-type H+-transporting ATPase subunit epsilon
MIVEIITPDRKVFSGTAESVKFPGIDGMFEVLDHHAPLITVGSGDVFLKSGEGNREWTIEGGMVEVLKNNVAILAEKVSEK